MYPVIPVFVASPSDVGPERRITEAAIQTLAPRLARLYGVTLVPLLWEEFAPISSFDATQPQFVILRRIQPFSVFVGILWNRLGTTVRGTSTTGTEMEFNHALENRQTISILTYFKEQGSPTGLAPSVLSQRRKVRQLRQRLQQDRDVLSVTYRTPREFRARIVPDLLEAVLDLVLSKEPRKVISYQKFFRFGSHSRIGAPPLLIVYPPITDPGPGHRAPRQDWRERLLPHVVYEDSKAIQDIEEAMRLLGREYKTVTTDSPLLDMSEPGDRVWVCIPRNHKARRVLEELGSRVMFRFDSIKDVDGRSETILTWNRSGKPITVRSPLVKYLSFSIRPEGKVEWRPAFGHAYCRDYAILARFRVYKDPEDEQGEYYYHYFVGGIRGLGTWGVGFLLDHESQRLERMGNGPRRRESSDDFQVLLEVTYENYRVTRVRDVSGESEAFFRNRCSDRYVRKQLVRHREWLPVPSTSGDTRRDRRPPRITRPRGKPRRSRA